MLIKLFLTFCKIGIFNFGGGYAILPLIEKEIVINNNWLDSHDFIDLVAISQITPGPISINSATFIGYRLSGVLGATLGTLGLIFPAFIITTLAVVLIQKYRNNEWVSCAFLGLRPAVVGLITAATYSIGKASVINVNSMLIAGVTAILVFKTKLNPIAILLIAGGIGGIMFS